MTGTVRVTGVAETRAAFARLAAQIKAGADAATDESAEATADDMRARVPVDSGQTLGEIGVHDGTLPGTKEVGLAETDHGTYVEFGTVDTDPQPFATPAAEAERAKLPGRVAEHVKGAIS